MRPQPPFGKAGSPDFSANVFWFRFSSTMSSLDGVVFQHFLKTTTLWTSIPLAVFNKTAPKWGLWGHDNAQTPAPNDHWGLISMLCRRFDEISSDLLDFQMNFCWTEKTCPLVCLRFAWKNSWNHIKWTFFCGGFSLFGTTVGRAAFVYITHFVTAQSAIRSSWLHKWKFWHFPALWWQPLGGHL